MNELDEALLGIRKYIEYLKELADKYRCLDTHAMKAFSKDPNIIHVSKETKISIWITAIFIIAFAILFHLMMLPIRLFADIRFIFEDIIKYLEK